VNVELDEKQKSGAGAIIAGAAASAKNDS